MSAVDRLDHLVIAAPDLEEGVEWAEALLGTPLLQGGRHPKWGTRNAVLPIGPSAYLEVIGPDPERETPALPHLFGIDRLTAPGLVAWATKSSQLGSVVAELRAIGLGMGDPVAGGRERPDGSRLSWMLTDPYAFDPAELVPFLIDWGESVHPAALWDGTVRILDLSAEHPEPPSLLSRLSLLGLEMPVERRAAATLVARLRTPRGEVELRRAQQ